MSDSTPQEWLRVWARRFPADKYSENIYRELIARHESLSAEDFVQIGKWKDAAKTEGKWKPNVAAVAYIIWMEAAQKLPKCPQESDVAAFLDYWSDRTYTDEYENGSTREKHFGLSRATALLHFISGGAYPIFDSRVRRAMARLLDSSVPPDTVRWYLDSYCPLFLEVAALCDTTDDLRMLDKALFSYGSSETLPFSN
jgi:hypothetical protein